MRCCAGLQSYSGAIADVPDHDSAFSHRDALVEFGAGTSWCDPAEDQDRIAAARRCTAALDQYPVLRCRESDPGYDHTMSAE